VLPLLGNPAAAGLKEDQAEAPEKEEGKQKMIRLPKGSQMYA
jgi:hypothetical protein